MLINTTLAFFNIGLLVKFSQLALIPLHLCIWFHVDSNHITLIHWNFFSFDEVCRLIEFIRGSFHVVLVQKQFFAIFYRMIHLWLNRLVTLIFLWFNNLEYCCMLIWLIIYNQVLIKYFCCLLFIWWASFDYSACYRLLSHINFLL